MLITSSKWCFLASVVGTSLVVHVNASPKPTRDGVHSDLSKRGNCCGRPLDIKQVVSGLTPATLEENDLSDARTAASTGSMFDHNSNLDDIWDPGDMFSLAIEGDMGMGPSILPADFLNPFGAQMSLDAIKNIGGDYGLSAIWESSLRKGKAMRVILDKYVSSKTRRIDDPGAGSKPKDIEENYDVNCKYAANWDKYDSDLKPFYDLVGVPYKQEVRKDAYWQCTVKSNAPVVAGFKPTIDPVLMAGINVDIGVVVVYEMYAYNDPNAPENKLYSSELTWQIWARAARAHALRFGLSPDAAVKGMKYVVQHNIANQETDNIVRLAHLSSVGLFNSDRSACVSAVPKPARGFQGTMALDTGQGRWLQDNPLFDVLLGIPNTRPTAQMLADHSTELDKPYFNVIHTFPRRKPDSKNGIRYQDSRLPTIIMELGLAPATFGGQASQNQAGVETIATE